MNRGLPSNSFVGPMLTDMYQISMTYAYWKGGRCDDLCVFDLFFRKCPFSGEFCIFAGLDEILPMINSFKFTESDIVYLKELLPHAEKEFFDWLLTLDCSRSRIYSVEHGTLIFPKEPFIRVEGPLCIGQLLETVLLNSVNYPSLVATNAARMRLAAGEDKILIEMGLRRAQGPDGGFSASKYSYIGGFNSTSNVLAGKLTGIEVKGTHAHAFVMSYKDFSDLKTTKIVSPDGLMVEFLELVLEKQKELRFSSTNVGELAAFISYAQSFPNGFLALIDTFDTIQSGAKNFIAVGYALFTLGYRPVGIRLDSGDLSYLSKKCRELFCEVDKQLGIVLFSTCTIVASDDINEDILLSLKEQGSEINSFGIGTNLVTCQKQPALGCVYKLVSMKGDPRIKLSQNPEKMVIPYSKKFYRLFGKDGYPLLDVILKTSETQPKVGEMIRCVHPYDDKKRVNVIPSRVEPLLRLVWNESEGIVHKVPNLKETREFVKDQLKAMRPDHIRNLNPTPYKVSVSQSLHSDMKKLWEEASPALELA